MIIIRVDHIKRKLCDESWDLQTQSRIVKRRLVQVKSIKLHTLFQIIDNTIEVDKIKDIKSPSQIN